MTTAASMAAWMMTDMTSGTAAIQETSVEAKANDLKQPEVRTVNLNIDGTIAGIHNPGQPAQANAKWAAGRGSYVYFGNYWQNDTNGDGKADSSDTKEQVKWRVLSVENDSQKGIHWNSNTNPDSLFLMSDRVLDCIRYNDRIYTEQGSQVFSGMDASYQNAARSAYFNDYESSNIRKWLLSETYEDWVCGNGCTGNLLGLVTFNNYTQGGFLKNAFSEQEIACIQSTYTSPDNQRFGFHSWMQDSYVDDDKVFLLGLKEVCTQQYGFYDITDSYFPNSCSAGAEVTEYAMGHANKILEDTNWLEGVKLGPCDKIEGMWLRSVTPGGGPMNTTATAGIVYATLSGFEIQSEAEIPHVIEWYDNKEFIGQLEKNNLGVAPALNLNRSSILFAMEHGYRADGNFQTTVESNTNEWDLTLNGGSGFSASLSQDTVKPGDRVQVTVTDIGTPKPGVTYNQISAMLVDEAGTVASYGKISNRLDPGGLTVQIPKDLEAGRYTMRVFAEQINENGVNFASNLESEELQIENNMKVIADVAITDLDAPQAGVEMDRTAVCATEGVFNTNPDASWSVEGVLFTREKADFHTVYTASVTLVPETGYAFADDIQPSSATVNGEPATSVIKNADETLTVTYTFPMTANAKLLRIITPEAVSGIANGTALADIPLPAVVQIETEDIRVTSAEVVWDRTSAVYDPTLLTEQTFVVHGTVILPANIDQNNVPLIAQIEVTVSEAGRVGAPLADVPSGTYEEDLLVGLHSSTEGAEIYYLVDGNTPDRENGILYTKKLPIRGVTGQSVTVTVQAIAVKEGMHDSTVTEYTYVVYIECQHKDGTNVQGEKQATCTEDGYTGDTICNVCEQVVQEGTVIPHRGHQFPENWTYDEKEHWKICLNGCGTVDEKAAHTIVSEITKVPTQEEEGTRTNHCTICEYSYTEILEKLPLQPRTKEPEATPSTEPVKSVPPSAKPAESAPPSKTPVETTPPSEKPVESVPPSIKPVETTSPSAKPTESAPSSEKPVETTPPSAKPAESTPPSEKPVETTPPSEKPAESVSPAGTVTVYQQTTAPKQIVSTRVQQLKTGDFSESDWYFCMAGISIACLILLEIYRKLRNISPDGE